MRWVLLRAAPQLWRAATGGTRPSHFAPRSSRRAAAAAAGGVRGRTMPQRRGNSGGANAASTDEWRVSAAAASGFPFVEQGLDLCRRRALPFSRRRSAHLAPHAPLRGRVCCGAAPTDALTAAAA